MRAVQKVIADLEAYRPLSIRQIHYRLLNVPPPDYLAEQLKAAIEANMDMETYEAVCEGEEEDCGKLSEIREQIASQLEV